MGGGDADGGGTDAHTMGRERDFRKPTRNHDSHSDLGSAAWQPSAEAGAGPVAERARADEFDAVGGACGEASEVAIALYFMAPSKWGWLTRQRSILWTTHRMPRMPGPWRRGRRGQRQTQLLSGDLALVAEGPDGPVTFAFRVVGVEKIE